MINSNLRYEPLPNTLFRFKIPAIATYSPEEISMYGMNVTVINGKPDMSSLYQLTPVSLPLDKIIDIYLNGYRPILLMDNDDIDKIYNILDEYVRGLNLRGNRVLNMPGVVEDRLYDIERFAGEIFDNNKMAILRKAIRFDHGYDAKVNTVNPFPLYNNTNTSMDNGGYSSHMDGYSTVLSNPNLNNPYTYQSSNNTNVDNGDPNSVLNAFRVNPNKEQVSSSVYINSNMPQMDFDSLYRKKTVIKLNKEQ